MVHSKQIMGRHKPQRRCTSNCACHTLGIPPSLCCNDSGEHLFLFSSCATATSLVVIVITVQDSTSSRLLPGSSYSCSIRNLHALVSKQCHPETLQQHMSFCNDNNGSCANRSSRPTTAVVGHEKSRWTSPSEKRSCSRTACTCVMLCDNGCCQLVRPPAVIVTNKPAAADTSRVPRPVGFKFQPLCSGGWWC
jgi:hypothetical protein